MKMPSIVPPVDVSDPAPKAPDGSRTSLEIVRGGLSDDPSGRNSRLTQFRREHLARWITSFHDLTHLNLEGRVNLFNDDVRDIAINCPALTSLNLNGCRLLDNDHPGVPAIGANLRKLKTLNASSCPLLEHLDAVAAGCTSLTSLNVSNCQYFGDRAVAGFVERRPNLESLNLMNTPVGNEGVASIAMACEKLTWLNITRCLKVNDDGLMVLAVRCTALRNLFLARCDITDVALQALGEYSSDLREIHLAGCGRVTDMGVGCLASGCRLLESLSVDTCAGISDEAAKALAASCAGLKVFQANGCSGLGDDGLVALAKSCKRLERLDVRGCARVTEHGLDVCAKQQPWAKVLAKRA